MANNYLQFSEVLTALTDQEHEWLRQQLEYVYVVGDREYKEADLPGDLDSHAIIWQGCRGLRERGYPDDDEYPGFEFAFEKDEQDEQRSQFLWLYAEECGDPSQVAYLVQQFLKKFRPDQCWAITYATTCSKPRVGEFAGGAVFVTAEGIEYCNAYDFIDERRAAFAARATLTPVSERTRA